MTSSTHHLSGMAADLRSCTSASQAAESFDFAGMSVSTIENVIRSAFVGSEAVWPSPIRLTIITGAGKLARQKYDPKAAQTITAILKNECGYVEDSGASAIPECAGSYKLQHDTGKNLKTVVVFPKIQSETDQGSQNSGPEKSAATNIILTPADPAYKLAVATFDSTTNNTFREMVRTKLSTWSQKKAAIAALDKFLVTLQEIDQHLVVGQPLSAEEQAIYEIMSTEDIQNKQAFLREQMQQQVEGGKITNEERTQLLQQVQDRIADLQKTSTTGAVQKQLEKAEERKNKLQAIQPLTTPPPLQHHIKITTLQKELSPLQKQVAAFSATSKLLSMAESQQVARRDDLVQEIERLQLASRGWFESDEQFQRRLALSQRATPAGTRTTVKTAAGTPQQGAPKGTLATNGKDGAPTKWVTPAPTQKSSAAAGNATKKKSPAVRGGGVFAAMMMDDDSD
jgi:hypothetical protein